MILGAGSVVAVALSGMQLLAGARESRLDALGFFQTDLTGDVAFAWTLFLLALLSFVVGEELVARGQTAPFGDGRPRSVTAATPRLQGNLLGAADDRARAGDSHQWGVEGASVRGARTYSGRRGGSAVDARAAACDHDRHHQSTLGLTVAGRPEHWSSRSS